MSADGTVAEANAAWRALVADLAPGGAAGGFVGRPFAELCRDLLPLETDRRSVLLGLQGVLGGVQASFRYDYLVTSAGRPAWFRLTLTPLPGGGALATHADVTLAKGAESAFGQLLESPMDALLVVDAHGHVQLANARAEAMFGYRRDELIGAGLERLLPERFRTRHAGHRAHFFASPHARPMGTGLELYALSRDGSEFPVEISLTPLTTEQGQVVVAAVRDVSERHHAERALHDAEQRLALHVRQTPLAVIEWRLEDGLITAWNPAAERIFGFRADEVVGLRRADLIMAEDDPQLRAILEGRGEGAGARHTNRNRTKDGRVILCEWYNTVLIDEAGRATGGAALALDVTARQRAVEALLSAQDEERTRISRDLHDGVGQALTAISLGLGAVLDADPSAQRAQLVGVKELVAKTLEDVRRISRDLRPALLDELGLEAAVTHFARELAERSGTEIDVLARLPQRLPRSAEAAVYRVVQEALTNVARHARATHASVVLTASGDRLHLVVEDNGDGFVPAEPAATVSVGLLGMRERVELLGGTLRLESTPGRGTIISARVPLERPF